MLNIAMSKKATTVEEQIEILKSRGMTISNEEKAKEHLLDIGYYRLGFYWYYFFEDEETQTFYKGTDLTDAIDLYYLDVDLRNMLSKYIYRIEVHFRTQVVYFVSNKFKEDPIWFCNPGIVDNFRPDLYDTLKDKNVHIIKHHNKHPTDTNTYAPAWKNLEFLTFGQILNIYNSLRCEEVKSEIANVYGLSDRRVRKKTKKKTIVIKNHKILRDYLAAILNIRNICSHSGVLFDYKQPKGINSIPDNNYELKDGDLSSLYASIRLISFILSKISLNRTLELIANIDCELNKAIAKNPKLKNIIKSHAGFNI